MKIEAAVVALTMTAVETFALVVVVAMAEGDGNFGRNRVATKVLRNKENGGGSGKSNGSKGGGQATMMATTWVIATETRLAGDKEGKCKGGKGNGDGDEGRQWRRRQQRLKRVSGGSSSNSGYGGGRQQQKLRGQARINKMRQAVAVAEETAAVAAGIIAARLQRQTGAAVRQK